MISMANTGHKKIGRSRGLAAKLIFAALQVLKEKGGELSSREVINEVEKRVDLDEWAKERYARTGYVRWHSILHFFTIDCIKAGFLIKKRGTWYLTPEGAQNVMMDYPELSGDAMKRAMHRIVVGYYLRPGYMAGALGRIVKDPRELVKFWHAGKKFLRYAVSGS